MFPDTETEKEPGTQPSESETDPVTETDEVTSETEATIDSPSFSETEEVPVDETSTSIPEHETESDMETSNKVKCQFQLDSTLGISGGYAYIENGKTVISLTVNEKFNPEREMQIMIFWGDTYLLNPSIEMEDGELKIKLSEYVDTRITVSISQ